MMIGMVGRLNILFQNSGTGMDTTRTVFMVTYNMILLII